MVWLNTAGEIMIYKKDGGGITLTEKKTQREHLLLHYEVASLDFNLANLRKPDLQKKTF